MAVIVLYVLSEGPFWLLIEKGVVPGNAIIVYDPAWRLVHVTGLSKGFGMYLHLWVPELYDRHGNCILHVVPD